MNLIIDLSFPFKHSSVSVKLIHNLLFVEACEYHGKRGEDYTKRFFKNYKKIDYTGPIKLKAFYKRGIVRIVDSGEPKGGEKAIVINVTHATPRRRPPTPPIDRRSITYDELKQSMKLMGFEL